MVKSAQFLKDGHVIFCLATHGAALGDFEQKNEKTLMDALEKCVKSQIGYIGGPGSPRVESLGEFMVQIEEHAKNGHWLLRVGTYNGEEMTAGQFLREAFIEYKEQCGKRAKDTFIGHATAGVVLRFDGRGELHFQFIDKIETGGGEHEVLFKLL